jgi:hypothetical protein
MKSQIKKISDAYFSDPITNATEVKRRNLIAIACATILISAYNLKVTKLPWIEIEAPKDAPNFLQGLLATTLSYALLVYAINALIDIARWRAASKIVFFAEQEELIRKLDGTIKHLKSNAAPSFGGIGSALPTPAMSEAYAFIHLLKKDVGSIRRRQLTLKTSLILRLAIVDLVLPIGLGAIGEKAVYSHLLPFISVPFQ